MQWQIYCLQNYFMKWNCLYCIFLFKTAFGNSFRGEYILFLVSPFIFVQFSLLFSESNFEINLECDNCDAIQTPYYLSYLLMLKERNIRL